MAWPHHLSSPPACWFPPPWPTPPRRPCCRARPQPSPDRRHGGFARYRPPKCRRISSQSSPFAWFALNFAAAYVDGDWFPLNPRNGMADSASIDPAEVAKFSALAAQWWDPAGKFAPLHKFNPVRLGFIRAEAAGHFGRDSRSLRPFEGLSLL